jgi:hypothetical protein
MNYSFVNDIYYNNYEELGTSIISNNNKKYEADKLLEDFNNLNSLHKSNLNLLINLEKAKEDIFNYNSTILSNHKNIMNIINACDNINDIDDNVNDIEDINDNDNNNNNDNNDNDELKEIIDNYSKKMNNYINKWIVNYYNKKINKLEMDIINQEEELAAFRKLFINTTNEIIKTEKVNKNMCPICFENEINMCAIPCGHTCCSSCVAANMRYQKTIIVKCLSCRNNINEYIKMYIQL